jgi:serine kinase of HPr protein (carbohydrate metabolism regulator)
VLELLQAAQAGLVPFARLVADDRAHLEPAHGRLLVRPAAALAGLLEVRGLGIRRVDAEPVAVVGLVVDLAAADAERLPQPSAGETTIEGVRLPRLGVASGIAPLPLLLARLHTSDPQL